MSGADSLAPFVGYTKNVESGILLVFYLTVIILLFLASEKINRCIILFRDHIDFAFYLNL